MSVFTVWLDGDMTDLTILAGAVVGLAWGLVADRIAARWPAHDDGAVRRVDWRTPVVAAVGAVAGALTLERFGDEPLHLLAIGVVVVGLVLLFATDLDQRLLPDVLTLPLVPYALILFVVGGSPYLAGTGDLLVAVIAAVLLPLGMYLLSLPFGAGAIGIGDLKLLAGVGLLGGAWRLIAALVSGAILAAVVIVFLIAIRRITLRSYVPYGPFLILGCLWALLVLSDISPV
jgi:leader peptidase (prepilin peptidase)/N-methyltransferase